MASSPAEGQWNRNRISKKEKGGRRKAKQTAWSGHNAGLRDEGLGKGGVVCWPPLVLNQRKDRRGR